MQILTLGLHNFLKIQVLCLNLQYVLHNYVYNWNLFKFSKKLVFFKFYTSLKWARKLSIFTNRRLWWVLLPNSCEFLVGCSYPLPGVGLKLHHISTEVNRVPFGIIRFLVSDQFQRQWSLWKFSRTMFVNLKRCHSNVKFSPFARN